RGLSPHTRFCACGEHPSPVAELRSAPPQERVSLVSIPPRERGGLMLPPPPRRPPRRGPHAARAAAHRHHPRSRLAAGADFRDVDAGLNQPRMGGVDGGPTPANPPEPGPRGGG